RDSAGPGRGRLRYAATGQGQCEHADRTRRGPAHAHARTAVGGHWSAWLAGRSSLALLVFRRAGGFGLPERLRDLREMAAHRRLRAIGIMAGDCLDDGAVLLVRLLGPAGDENRPILKAYLLWLEQFEQPCRGRVVRDAQQHLMQLGVDIRASEQITGVDALPLLREQPEERVALRQRHLHGGVAGRQAFERGARLQNLDGLLLRDETHPRAPIAL